MSPKQQGPPAPIKNVFEPTSSVLPRVFFPSRAPFLENGERCNRIAALPQLLFLGGCCKLEALRFKELLPRSSEGRSERAAENEAGCSGIGICQSHHAAPTQARRLKIISFFFGGGGRWLISALFAIWEGHTALASPYTSNPAVPAPPLSRHLFFETCSRLPSHFERKKGPLRWQPA